MYEFLTRFIMSCGNGCLV